MPFPDFPADPFALESETLVASPPAGWPGNGRPLDALADRSRASYLYECANQD